MGKFEDERANAVFDLLMDAWDISKIFAAFEAEYQRGRDDYRDELLAQMDASRGCARPLATGSIATLPNPIPPKPAEPVTEKPSGAPVGEKVSSTPAAPEKRTSEAPGPGNSARVSDHPKRPAGIPTTFEMMRTVLTELGPLTVQELGSHIADRWWPGMTWKFISPDVSTGITKGRLLRDADGKLSLTDHGKTFVSYDNRPQAAGTQPPQPAAKRPDSPLASRSPPSGGSVVKPAPQREVVIVAPKMGPPSKAEGVEITYRGERATLRQKESTVFGHLLVAMGLGHLDAKFLGDSIGAKMDAELVVRDIMLAVNPKIAPLGLLIEFFKGYGFIMKEI